MPEADSRGLSKVLSLRPRHGVGGPDLEVVAGLLSALVLVASARSLCPTAKHDDVGAGDVHSMAKAMLRRGTTDSKTGPDESFGIQHSDVVQVTFLQSCTLLASTCAPHVLLVEPKAAVDDQV